MGPDKKNNDKFENLYNFAKTNTRDIIAYVLMVLGLILIFLPSTILLGGFIIGVVVGLYFTPEILGTLKNYETIVNHEGLVRSLILGGTLIAFLISAPAIFIGAALVILLRMLITSSDKT